MNISTKNSTTSLIKRSIFNSQFFEDCLRLVYETQTIKDRVLFDKWSYVAFEDLTSKNEQIYDHESSIENIKYFIDKLEKPNQVIYFKNLIERSEKVLELLKQSYTENMDIFFKILKNPDYPDNVSLMRIATNKNR
jgi:hypothetical protein